MADEELQEVVRCAVMAVISEAPTEHEAAIVEMSDQIATLTAERDALREIVKEVAEMTTQETEYAGRMESYCAGCDEYIENGDFEGAKHGEWCLIMMARAALKQGEG